MFKGWKHVREFLLTQIEVKSEGESLGSDKHIAKQIGCSIPTVKRAMAELARQGYISRRRGHLTRVSSKPFLVQANEFSFQHTAEQIYGQNLTTQIIEQACRTPNPDYPDGHEVRAQQAFGLKKNERFFVIVRRRILEKRPRVIHRSYLNRAYLPEYFLEDHNFHQESIPKILESHGLRLQSRHTKIRAVLPTDQEARLLDIGSEPVLRVEQEMKAIAPNTNQLVTIEYLHATYVDWEYAIEDRRTGESTRGASQNVREIRRK